MCVVAVVAVPYVVVARVCVCVCGCFLDRAREATRDRATHGIVCALSTARRVAVAVVAAAVAAAVACVVVACVRVRTLDRAREATRDRATHGIVRALSTARQVAVVVVSACVAVARVCACVRVCLFCITPRSIP